MSELLEIVLIVFVILGVVVWGGTFGVIYTWYRKATTSKKCDALFNYDPDIKTTTHLPIPLSAAECNHSWSVVDKAVLEMPHEQKYVMTMKCDLCGVIDKTIEVTSKMPPPQPPPPCRHEWETVQNETIGGDVGDHKVIVVLKCNKCGVLDKTVETIKVPPPPVPPAPLVPRSECRHKWVTEKSVYLESAYEQIVKGLKKSVKNQDKKNELDLDEAPKWMFRKAYVGVRICSLCGEIDKFIGHNIDLTEGEEEPEEKD